MCARAEVFLGRCYVRGVKWQRWHAIAAAAVALIIGVFVLKSCDHSSTSPAEDGGLVETAIGAPDDVLGDLVIPSPNATWAKLQKSIGGAAAILPATLPGVVVALADLDLALADELDGSSPMYGVAAGDPGDPALALALKVRDPSRTKARLVGDGGPYSGRDVVGMTILTSTSPRSRDHFEVALTKSGYLLVARKVEDLTRLGPYVTRTLPTRSVSAEAATIEIPRRALEANLKSKVERSWRDGKTYLLEQDSRMRAEKGRAPDFGDPAAIIEVLDAMLGRRVQILADLERIKVGLDVTDDSVAVTATMAPRSPSGPAHSWIASMLVGDPAPLKKLPLVSTLALTARDTEGERAAQVAELERGIVSALGARLKEPTKLHDALSALTKARDDVFAVAAGLEEPGGVFLRAHVRDEGAAEQSIRGVVALTRADPFKEILHVKDVASSSEELPGFGKIQVATITRDMPAPTPKRSDGGAPAHAPAKNLGLAWSVNEGQVMIGAGSEPLVTLKVATKAEKTLGDEPGLGRFLGAIASDASTIVVAQPLRLDPTRANLPFSPLGIAIGRRGDNAFARIEISSGLLREAARWQLGL